MSDMPTAEKDAPSLLCRLGLHRFRGPGCEPFFGAFYEPFCLRGCGKPRVIPPGAETDQSDTEQHAACPIPPGSEGLS